MLQITVEYTRTPPQVFISKLRQFCTENRDPHGCHMSLHWVKAPEPPAEEEKEQLQERLQGNGRDAHKQKTNFTLNPVFLCCTVYAHPRGYRTSPRCPALRAEGHCPDCLCTPCIITVPPDFLKGSCNAHPVNAEKRHGLYRKFWGLLNDLGVWRDPEYLRRKERRTVRDDRRDVLPACVLKVQYNNLISAT